MCDDVFVKTLHISKVPITDCRISYFVLERFVKALELLRASPLATFMKHNCHWALVTSIAPALLVTGAFNRLPVDLLVDSGPWCRLDL